MKKGATAAGSPLPTLLSQALVAFTIEFDNEYEHQMPHGTTDYGWSSVSQKGPWLVSLVMFENCMRFVGDEGVRFGELTRLAGTQTNLNGMQRWGYIVVEADSGGAGRKPPRSTWLIRATRYGRQAREVWRPLFGVIEQRWQARFGEQEAGRLRASLESLNSRLDAGLPDSLPILGYGLWSGIPDRGKSAPIERASDAGVSLSALLSRVLLAFAIEFERESELSLAISANVLRVLDEKGVRVQDLPKLSGVSKESISMAMGILRNEQLAVVGPDPAGSRAKVIRLTPKGRKAQDDYHRLLSTVEKRWEKLYGKGAIGAVREPLEGLAGDLFLGLEPYPDGWRASVRKPDVLPHYPMVLHRGGYPDGS